MHRINPELIISNKQFTTNRDAYGIVFLTEVKVGALAGGKMGTGIIITRIENKEDEWSAPIAIGTGGLSFGFQAGVSKVDHIIILPSPNHVKTFLGMLINLILSINNTVNMTSQ